MKSVLFVIQEYSQGGINKCLENLLPFMTKSYQVSIFCMYEDGGDYYKRVFAPYILKKSLLYYLLHDNVYTRKAMGFYNKITGQNHFSFLYKYEAIFQQKRKDVDVIVAYHEGMTAEFVSYFPKGRKVAWFHCNPYFWGEANFLKYKRFYEKIDSIVCVSNAVKSSLKRMFGKYEGKIVSIHNVVNSEELKKKSLEPINDFQNHNNDFRIISIGRSTKVKQFEKIPKIIRNMLDKGCNRVQWFIMSSGHELDKEIESEIKSGALGNMCFLWERGIILIHI